MTKPSDRAIIGDESGATMLFVAILMVVLLAMGAFAVDLGLAYSVKRKLSSTADSAALAGAQEAALEYVASEGCGTPLYDKIIEAVKANHAANLPIIGSPQVEVTYSDIDCSLNEVSVTVREKSEIPAFLAQFLGIESLTPGAAATAAAYGTPSIGGLRPFTVCMTEIINRTDHDGPFVSGKTLVPGQLMITNFGQHDKGVDGCQPTNTPGEWGPAVFHPSLNNANALRCLILYGYGGGPECEPTDAVQIGTNLPLALDDVAPADADYNGEVLPATEGTWDSDGDGYVGPIEGTNDHTLWPRKHPIDSTITETYNGVDVVAPALTGIKSGALVNADILDELFGKTMHLPLGDFFEKVKPGAGDYRAYGAIPVVFRGFAIPKASVKPLGYEVQCGSTPNTPDSALTASCQSLFVASRDLWPTLDLAIFWEYVPTPFLNGDVPGGKPGCPLGSNALSCPTRLALVK